MRELRHRTTITMGDAPPAVLPSRQVSSGRNSDTAVSGASMLNHRRRRRIHADVVVPHYITRIVTTFGIAITICILMSARITSMASSQSMSLFDTIADSTLALSAYITGRSGFYITDEAPFVVIDPTGLRVHSDKADTSTYTTLPFGAIVILTDLKRLKTGEMMRITFPYEGFIVNGRGGWTRGFEGRVWWAPCVMPLVGDMSALRLQSKPPAAAAMSPVDALKCCKFDATRNYQANITWEEYRDGRYSAADYRDPIRAGMNDDIPDVLSNAPPWTIQYQPATDWRARNGASSSSFSTWSAPTWLDQVPIGSGRTFALVGSTASTSVVPISTAGLFVPPRAKNSKAPPPKQDKSDNGRIFQAAREALLRGDHAAADKLVGQLHRQSAQENPMASLEYAADLTLVFSANPLQLAAVGGGTTRDLSHPGKQKRRAGSARDALVKNLVSSIIPRSLNKTDARLRSLPVLDPSLDQLLARGQLDLRGGVYGESFITSAPARTGTSDSHYGTNSSIWGEGDVSGLFLHHREYFATLDEHTIAARLQCRDLPSSEVYGGDKVRRWQRRKSKCLNFAASLSRTDGGGSAVSSRAWSAPLFFGATAGNGTNELSALQQKLATAGKRTSTQSYSERAIFGVSISGNTAAPNVEVCGVVICEGEDATSLEMSDDGKAICSSAASADIVLGIEIESRGRDITPFTGASSGRLRSPSELKADCQKRLLKVLEAGYIAMRKNHSGKFSEIMSSMDISFTGRSRGEATSEVCHGHVISDLIQSSTTRTCEAAGDSTALSASLLRTQFQLSRYLLLSAAAASVPNLQAWGDGPVSAWSGDYHLNVNLQMMYWGTGTVGLAATHRPLLPFIKSLSNVGRAAAQRMYNCSADSWVTHGNTDHTLDGSLRAESYWVFCATCGVWAALQLFENLLYSRLDSTRAADIADTLSVLRGAVRFLQEYTFVDPSSGIRHTGPGTSPENSYLVFRNVTSVGNETFPAFSWTQHLAFSPAFDLSLTRQLANAFPLLTKWADDILDQSDYSSTMRDADKLMALDIAKLALDLPFQAQPAIGDNGVVLEYPMPLGSCGRHVQASQSILTKKGRASAPVCFPDNANNTAPLLVEESPDTGHRHFSGMHWLYPNTFMPLGKGEELFDAALKSLDLKRKAGGGHTGWSAGWMAALSARLRDGQGAWDSIGRLIGHYTARNGLELHPPLAGLPKNKYSLGNFASTPPEKGCGTCFHEKDMSARGSVFSPALSRGLETDRSDKFQLDGHGGLVAAISELMLMSHIPGTMFILPGFSSLPLSADGGVVRGLRGRGDVAISAVWTGKARALSIVGVEMRFASRHPWLYGSTWKESDGYYTYHGVDEGADLTTRPALLRVYVPVRDGNNEPMKMDPLTCAKQVDEATFISSLDADRPTLPSRLTSGMAAVCLSINSFPCVVRFCSRHAFESGGDHGCRVL